MTDENIRKYAQLMKELDLTALEITEGENKIRLERSVSQTVQIPVGPVPMPAQAPVQNAPAAPAAPSHAGTKVTSPMVGIFYAAPAENREPYVKVGDRVKKGDPLCIIEAMKLMNEINAERDGVIAEICAENGQTVEYGTVLFRMED